MYEENDNPVLINCLCFTKLVAFPSLVHNIAGFHLSCLNKPLKIFPSNVISK